jgi:hypothetical protein
MDGQELEEASSPSQADGVLSDTDDTQGDAASLSMANGSSLHHGSLKYNHHHNNSPLLRLPPELRNYIYELAVVPVNGVAGVYPWDRVRAARDRTAVQPPITQTCRKIRNEALPIFYDCSVLYLKPDYWVSPEMMKREMHHERYWEALNFMAGIGEKNRANLAHIVVEVNGVIYEPGEEYAVRVTRSILQEYIPQNKAVAISVLNRKNVKELPALAQDYFENMRRWYGVGDDEDSDLVEEDDQDLEEEDDRALWEEDDNDLWEEDDSNQGEEDDSEGEDDNSYGVSDEQSEHDHTYLVYVKLKCQIGCSV